MGEDVARPPSLPSEKRRLLSLLLKKQGDHSGSLEILPRREASQACPLSFAQERLFFFEQLKMGTPYHTIAHAISLKGLLRLNAFSSSINQIVRRHEILRTTFGLENGQPVQHVGPSFQLLPAVIDLSLLTKDEQEIEFQRLAYEEAWRSFDLEHGPLLRITLLRLGREEHRLLFSMHHIISDGWSIGIFVQELLQLYTAYSQQRPVKLRPLPVQYADFACWQRASMKGEQLENLLVYWRGRLAHAPLLLELPYDRIRPVRPTFRGAKYHLMISAAQVEALRALGKQHAASLYMVLLAAWFLLLSRYTDREDILVGSPVANREQKELEPLMGCFVNMLVLRADLTGTPSFQTLLARVRETCLEAYEHQRIPFDILVKDLLSAHSLRHHPIFQAVFVLQNMPMPALTVAGLSIDRVEIDYKTAQFDVTLNLEEAANGTLRGWFEYSTDLFKEATIARMAEHWQLVLNGVVNDPTCAISELSILTPTERLIVAQDVCGQLVRPLGEMHQSIPRLFEMQVEASPHACAVMFEDQQLTYGELNRRANQLASYLRRLGVGPEMLVGLYVERSLELVVGILGILKTGGVYVPFDPASPRERLTFMLADAAPVAVVTQLQLLERLPTGVRNVVVLDEIGERLAQEEASNLSQTINPLQLAYVIYTSGSTGRPKGVMVTHANVTRLFAVCQPQFNFHAGDVWTLFHSAAFDFSVWEIWGALLNGGQLVIVPYWTSRSPEAFYQLVYERKVTIVNQTPSAFRQFMPVEATQNKRLSLRLVIFGGEALDVQGLRPWFERHGDQVPQLVNMYGITETTVHVTWRLLTRADLEQTPGSMIGKPLADLHIYVLDRLLRPVPIGVRGEMYIGGAGVGRGYLHRPGLTAERFIGHHLTAGTGQRLYKTGDIARYLDNGEIEYFGRNDDQVKIRGFRIELQEIEAAFYRLPAVHEVCVLMREDKVGQRQLVAYLVSKPGRLLTVSVLRQHLQHYLPEYMIPSAFVMLEKFPLTENGKLDRSLLPYPEVTSPASLADFVAPETSTEKALAQIWTRVLGVERVGVRDNFFELGGDSILSIRVCALANELQLGVTVQHLFEYPTLGELAAELERSRFLTLDVQEMPSDLIAASDRERLPHDIEDAYPLTRLQAGILFYSEQNPTTSIYHDVFSYHVRAPLCLHHLQTAFQHLCKQHPILRTSFELTQFRQPLQVVHRAVFPLLDWEDVSALPSSQQEDLIETYLAAEKYRPFEKTQAPLLRIKLHQRSPERFQFTLSMHHVILDGWSVASLLSELFKLALELREGGEPSIQMKGPLQSTFRDFVALEQQVTKSKAHQQYWSRILQNSNVTPLTQRLTLLKRRQLAHRMYTREIALPKGTSEALMNLAHLAGVPLKSVLFAGHFKVLSHLTGRPEILTGLVTNGRLETLDGDRVLGLFLNTVPVKAYLSGQSWIDLARLAFTIEQELLPFRRYPVLQFLNKNPGEPLFETIFNFVHFHIYQSIVELPDVEILGAKVFSETDFALVANFSLDVRSSTILLHLNGDSSLFDEQWIDEAGSTYARVLAAMADTPHADHRQCSLLSVEERHRLLVEWNQTNAAYPKNQTYHEWFEAQVERTPDAVAVAFEDQRMTYHELNVRANQLARFLQTGGVGRETRVALCMERSIELVVGLLGILKAGGVYVPLDPLYPSKRLSFILIDAQVKVVVTQKRLSHRFASGDLLTVWLDAWQQEIARQDCANPPRVALPTALAYIFYTSGSTGMPKGVMVEHQSLVNYLHWVTDLLADISVPLITTLTFDGSIRQLFAPLICGREVWILSERVATQPLLLLAELEQQMHVGLSCVPSFWRVVIDALSPASLGALTRSLKRLILGGERPDRHLLQQTFTLFPELQIWNFYGPTETTVSASCARLFSWEHVPIGRPIANVQVYLLDSFMQPVPVGVPGEVYIGGVGLARGYVDRPDLTAERFLPDPYGEADGGRLYRTGDLARYHSDGSLEYLGRLDRQVKISGVRIELAEIEAVLLRHPLMKAAAVLTYRDAANYERLVAYLSCHQPSAFSERDVRLFLKAYLPDYMLPSAFIMLEQFPQTFNGKLDVAALPSPEARSRMAKTFVAPRTPLEELLAAIYAELLGVDEISVNESFFEMGGHSLTATQAISHIRQVVQVDVPLHLPFDEPTISGLAAWIERQLSVPQHQPMAAIPMVARDQPLLLSFAQQRLWFLEQLHPGDTVYVIPFVIQLQGDVSIKTLIACLNEVVSRHESLRTTFFARDGQPFQRILPELYLLCPLVDMTECEPDEREHAVERLSLAEAAQGFDLVQGPLIRLTFLRLKKDQHVLLLTMHHIISDAWSMGVLVKELLTLYEAFIQRQPSPLPALALQYPDFAMWQRQWLQGSVLEEQLSYWRKRLASAPEVQVPGDHPRPMIPTFRGSSVSSALSSSLSLALKKLSYQEKTTLFMTLFAGFDLLLAYRTGQYDLVVGTPIANRTRVETENLIGFFVNTLALRVDLAGNPTFRVLLKRVRSAALEAYTHQDVPFEKLVEELKPRRSLGYHPLFQITFDTQNAPLPPLELPGLVMTPVVANRGKARFDLAFSVVDSAEGLVIIVEYSVDLFEERTIASMILQYEGFLSLIVEQPDLCLSDLMSLLAQREQQQLLGVQKEQRAKNLSRLRAVKQRNARK